MRMKFLALAALIAAAMVPAAALAQTTYPTGAPGVKVGGVVPLVCNAGVTQCVPAGSAGSGSGTTGDPTAVQGNVASAATDAGNPVKIGYRDTSGNRRDLQGDTAGAAFVVAKGGGTLATGQVAVTTTSTLVAAARAGRQQITLSPTSSVVYYVGATGVTTATGVYVAAGASITLETAAAVYAVGASNVTISFVELY